MFESPSKDIVNVSRFPLELEKESWKKNHKMGGGGGGVIMEFCEES